ncbi:MAG TPA: DUF222 domain-containing protein, partial [Ilumatobacteraceae bacterium]|nr:DUF222 domain-containing protein [Ilumatobacteraceae bacterium]
SEITAAVPSFGTSLDTGRVTGEHVDALGVVMRQLEPAARAELATKADHLLILAEQLPADEFAKRLRREARRLESDSDAQARLQRQKRAIRLDTWLDRGSGMGRWSAWWDPETMLRLENRLDAQVDALFHDAAPAGCPNDTLEKQAYLRALALLAILDGGGVRLGRPEIVVVVDHTQPGPDGTPTIDWDLPVDLPPSTLAELARRAVTHTVVVRNNQVVAAPGKLDLGRSSRLASPDQRRALHALYPRCAIPGCQVRFSRTRAHHVRYYTRDHGPTDLANLLPICEHHHHKVHNDNWMLTLTVDRQLTIKLPDGQVMTTGPPRRNAA